MRRLLSAMLVIAFSSTLVLAENPPYRSRIAADDVWSWTGLYLGAGAGAQLGDTTFDATHNTDTLLNISGLSSFGWKGNARLGFDYQMGQIVVGPFIGYSYGDHEWSASTDLFGGHGLSATFTPTWDAGVRIGWVAPNKSLWYGGYRYQAGEFSLNGSGGLDNLCKEPEVRCSHNVNGHGFILGVEVPITKAMTFSLEYGFTRLDSIEVATFDGGAGRVSLDPEVHEVMGRLNFRFGPNLWN